MASGSHHQPKPHPIRTFVMFDTETTGLQPDYPKITEICFFAVSRKDLMNSEKPRVMSKFLMSFNPTKPIGEEASQVSGIPDSEVESLAPFEERITLLCDFLETLPRPACLIAHNGRSFHFSLLVRELREAGRKIPDILCVDSLEAFRMLDDLPPIRPICEDSPSYALPKLYKRTSGKEMQITQKAENDCEMLLEISHVKSLDFIPLCDERVIPLNAIPPMP